MRKSGRDVFYVLNRYINSTNICYANCKFCSFAADEKKEPERAVRMSADEVFAKALETGTNFNQIHIVGGHDPRQLSLDYWLPLMRRFRARLPHVQLSLFTAAEIDYLARRHRLSYEEILVRAARRRPRQHQRRRRRGLQRTFSQARLPEQGRRGALARDPRGGASRRDRVERDDAVRDDRDARGTGRTPDHAARIAARSPGYNAFIPLAFHPDGNELSDYGWTSGLDDIRMFATARLMLDNFDHIKAYWMIQGLKVCQLALQYGADDMDGTHGSTDEERIYHSAGTHSGQHVDDREFRRLIEEAGFTPVRRNSTYDRFAFDWAPIEPDSRRAEPQPAGSSVLRAGRINYTNDLPIYCAFDEGAVAFPGALVADVPAAAERGAARREPRHQPRERLLLRRARRRTRADARSLHRLARRGVVGRSSRARGRPSALDGARDRRDDGVGERP